MEKENGLFGAAGQIHSCAPKVLKFKSADATLKFFGSFALSPPEPEILPPVYPAGPLFS